MSVSSTTALSLHPAEGVKGLRIPRHVAVIMDGNGRWASQRGLPRSAGHKAGMASLRRLVKAATEYGVEYLTIYAFSTENWQRPRLEVVLLMELLRRFIRQDVNDLNAEGVKIKIIGSRDNLDRSLLTLLSGAEKLTQNNTRLTLNVAFNYGGRQEIANTIKKMTPLLISGALKAEDITPELISQYMETATAPDPDLLIRTGGEQRISNFLLWQCAYTELVFEDSYWPEFTAETLSKAIAEYNRRERRFGGLQAISA